VNALSIAKLKSSKDHITTLGFKNDGYDYSQHLKEIGILFFFHLSSDPPLQAEETTSGKMAK
jgi:hypothetical protein